ncbi:hypothetical protein L226DRAFT_616897 [Lentinus tigrinus ALCF2SS1-7]|uniref:F-box domain-containing protein n=1 Tax=Lentinus tigrinus ALCF2SS1-6 TaxID=1328759 RepID=A0A5C2RV85_9APHY|nr:hypothetical protein L227DRAFT_604045 [Lentinus tigrinus ALCF2SS1-6]RPD69365.1 hypothetical protein L226DRAFT_616897 [Lentinus tigrinus ALCF2SS1-7]
MMARRHINEDIVFELVLYLEAKEQAAAARVAHLWTLPAQKSLYRSITYHTSDKAPHSSGQRLVKTLRSHPDLRALVRLITIHSTDADLPQLDWVDLFTNDTIRKFTYICRPRTVFAPVLLQKDAIRRIPHLTLNGPMWPDSLKTCFELPMVETLELELNERNLQRNPSFLERVLKLDAFKVPNLKHLYLHARYVSDSVVSVIVAAFAAQLHSLHVHASLGQELNFKRDPKAEWAQEFVGHVRRGKKLTRVVFSGFNPSGALPLLEPFRQPWNDAWVAAALEQKIFGPLRRKEHLYPFLDAIAQQSAVEHLCCIDGSYTEELFHKLSRKIKVLEFYFDEETFDCEGALLELLGRVGRDGLGLRMVRFFACEERRTLLEVIDAACKKNGITFQFVPAIPPLHQLPSRPPIIQD